MTKTDVAIIGGGINGGSTGLELAKNGLNTTIIDKSFICKGASGVNAGTLTMHMTRAQLIPYAKKGWELWMNTSQWLRFLDSSCYRTDKQRSRIVWKIKNTNRPIDTSVGTLLSHNF